MRAFSRASLVVALLLTADFGHAADVNKFNLKVVDEQGRPVPKFEAMIYSGAGLFWAAGADGSVSLSADQLPPVVRVVIRADGYASTAKQCSGSAREKLLHGAGSITLSPGEEVKLQFHLPEGLTWPKGAMPEVYFDAWTEVMRSTRSAEGRRWYESRNGNKPLDLNMLNLRQDDAGNFVFRLAPSTPAFDVGINIPGFLQYFDAGPFMPANLQNGSLQIDLPQPANLEVSLNLGSSPLDDLPFQRVRYQVLFQRPGQKNLAEMASQDVAPGAKPFLLADIPSGKYLASVFTLSAADTVPVFSEDADPSRFRDNKVIALGAGQTEKVDFQYVPLEEVICGQRTAVLHFETADGKPAAGRDVAITYFVEHYGSLPIFSGPVPDSGDITLNDLTDARPAALGSRDPFSVRVGKVRVGTFGFNTSEPTEHFVFRCPPVAGDMAPDVELLNVADGKTIKLSDLHGKLVLLDFWATWCGPCQPALEKLDQVAAEKAKAWKDRVAVVPVSIDNESEQAKKHLIGRGWTHLNSYWTGAEGKLSFEAPAMQAFVVNGVPTSFLIDAEGTILWRGHPLSSEGGKTLEDRIEAALRPQ